MKQLEKNSLFGRRMNKLMILALLVAVFSMIIDSAEGQWKNRASGRKRPTGICGGCGCNIFNCNCDWTPQECGACPHCKSSFWDAIPSSLLQAVIPKPGLLGLLGRKKRSLEVGEYMDFEAADLDGNGLMNITEFSLAYDGLVYSNKFIGVDFNALDADKDGLISRLESGLDLSF